MQHHLIKQVGQQTHNRQYAEKVARFRKAFPPVLGPYSQLITFVKKVGSRLTIFLKKQTQQAEKCDNKIEQDIQSQFQPKHKGKILDFNSFVAEGILRKHIQEDLQHKQADYQRKETFKKKGRIFDIRSFFRPHFEDEQQAQENQIKNQNISKSKSEIKQSSRQPAQQSNNPRKYLTKNIQYENDQKLTQAIFRSSHKKARRINEIYNQANYDRFDILQQARQIREREEINKPKSTLVQRYQKYLKSLGFDNQRDCTQINHQRLCQLMKRSRQIVQKKPLKKRVHVQQDLPPIYNIKKVMEVLQMQSKQFFQEKRQKQNQQARKKRQMDRLEQLQKQSRRRAEQKRLLEQQQLQQIIRKEIQYRQIQKLLQEPSQYNQNQNNRIDLGYQIDLVPTKIQRLGKQLPKGQKQIQSSSIQDNKQDNIIVNAVKSFNSPIIQRQQQKTLFSTPSKKAVQNLQQKIDQTLHQVQENKNIVRENPFTKPKTTALNINDLINKNPSSLFSFKKQTEQSLLASTVGQAFFSPNQQGHKLFNLNQVQTNVQPQTTYFQNIQSPTKVMGNPIQTISSNLASNGNNLFNISTPFSAVNQIGSSFNQSSINSLSNPSIFSRPSPELAVHSEPPANRSFSSLLSNNPEAARMFDHNLFAANRTTDQISLFGPPPQTTNTKQIAARSRKAKNQIRIN